MTANETLNGTHNGVQNGISNIAQDTTADATQPTTSIQLQGKVIAIDAYDAASIALLDHLSGGRLCRPEASFNVGVDVSVKRVFIKPAITLDQKKQYTS